MITGDDRDDEFLLTATRAMAASGAGALDALGWWDLLAHVDDPDARDALFAGFRAQGRELVGSPALGVIVALPYLAAAGLDPGAAVAAIGRSTPQRGLVWDLLGDPGGRPVLFDVPGEGVHLVDADKIVPRAVEVAGGADLREVTADLSGPSLLTRDVAERLRPRALYLGRVAAAHEILGASERAVGLALDHARVREQFGQPIGGFQAVRHLLAWAKTDCIAIDSVARRALLVLDDPPPHLDEALKALAGRNGRRACERSLQVLGGIGFTAEHDHHQHHSRVLLLDALLGTSSELTRHLGAWLRTGGEPTFARTVLARGPG